MMETLTQTIAGINFTFEDMKTRQGFTWMVTAENVAFILYSEDGKHWEFRGKVSVWLQELKPHFISIIKDKCKVRF